MHRRTAMTNRERFQAVTRFQPFDRLPLVEWAMWWDKTIERWHREGLPASVTGRHDIERYFGLDVYWQDWWRPVHWEAPRPAGHGLGVIADEAGYDRFRPWLFQVLDRWPLDPDRWRAAAEKQRRGEWVLWFTMEGFFWFPRVLLGIERHFYAFYDQPDLLHRINADLADWMLRLIDRVCDFCVPDFMTFAEDMSYNHGPMLSEEQFDTFLLPYYHRVIPRLRERGILPIVDSDGDITRAVPWFERAGLGGILPLERQAGVDVGRLRRDHPRLVWIGAFDKMTMNRGEAAVRAEFERLLPAAQGGGLIVSCDHQTPPGVSLDEYGRYLRLFREHALRAAGGPA
jgi:hypothetical protein